ncbi:hypothetical protein [Xenorhabdus szentirmaii]|uniref:hypothetical protein n=1 Tax=Xenorhabdus szentirmaii TaxID=290112 RepID=UPI00117EBCEE|nr:hypothetical protein [Xenorhabdus szentirmaii]
MVYRKEGDFQAYDLYHTLLNDKKTWLQENADNIVYPDSGDDVLKTKVAEYYRGHRQSSLVSGLATALFGDHYQTAMAGYGETASPSLITELITEYLRSKLNAYSDDKANMLGTGTEQLAQFLKTGAYDAARFISSALGCKTYRAPSQYRNAEDFERELSQQRQIIAERINNTVAGHGKAAAHQAYRMFTSALNANLATVVERVQAFPGYQRFDANYTQDSGVFATDFANLFADAVALGFIEGLEITESLFLMVQQRDELVDKIHSRYSKSRYEATFWDKIQVKAGLLTQESVDHANAEKARLEQEAQEIRVAQLEKNIMVKTNSTAIRGGKGANRYDYAPDGCYCLNDTRGKAGALFEVKEELKADFDAKYYNGRNPGDELAGSWWLISKAHALDDILSVIQKYEQ